MPSSGRTMVLIHGAWQGSWSFEAWRPRLEARGWRIIAVDLPGNGWNPASITGDALTCYTSHVVEILRGLDGPAVVLGHSGGGITASQVAEAAPELLAGVVYLAGMMLPSGVSFIEFLRQCAAAHPGADLRGISPHLLHTPGTTAVPPEAALEIFLHDCPPEAARHAAGLFRPQPEIGRDMRPHLTAARYGRVKRYYVEAVRDRSIYHLLQREMQARSPGAHRITLDCGHVPQLACPTELTARLCDALDAG